MELYVSNSWTERYGNSYIAEAIVWSESKLKPMPETSMKAQ
jgi:hypothetical protein